MKPTTKHAKKPPQRPPTPNSKGLTNAVDLNVKFPPQQLRNLRDRARYETMHWRLEHRGRGHVISPADIVRRVVAEYFDRVSAMPDDAIAAALRATEPR